MLDKVISFLQCHVDVSKDQIDIIKAAAENILFNESIAWNKRKGENFDITMGGYAGAEICEAVGLWILSLLEKRGISANLYRDDGLLMTNKPARATENIKKNICEIFKEIGLKITIEANKNSVDFLDVTLNLEEDTYEPFSKPNNTIMYVHSKSNHPSNTLKNIPLGVQNQISDLSKTEEIFNSHVHLYQEALNRAGYNFKLKYCKSERNNKNANKKVRQRKVIYFNPPFSISVETDVGKKILNLVSKCFPKGSHLNKILNRNTLKVTYSCLPNMAARTASNNLSKLRENKEEVIDPCTCRKTCPVGGICKTKNTIYECKLSADNQIFKYIGKSSTTFIERFRNHKKAIKHKKYSKDSELTKKIWQLKNSNTDYSLEWNIRKVTNSYKPGSKFCQLCLEEVYQIIFYKENEILLNERNELWKKCRHKRKFKLNQE